MGVCYVGWDESEPVNHSFLGFRLLDHLGAPLGQQIRFDTEPGALESSFCQCSLGWSGSEFLLTYERCGGLDDDDAGTWLQRIRPRI